MQGFVFKLLACSCYDPTATPTRRKSDSCGHFPIFDAVNCTVQAQRCLQVDAVAFARETPLVLFFLVR